MQNAEKVNEFNESNAKNNAKGEKSLPADVEARYAIKIPKDEYAVLKAEIMKRNNIFKNASTPIDCVYTANNFYIYENYGNDDFKVLKKYDIDKNRDIINSFVKELNNGNVKSAKGFIDWTTAFRRRQQNNSVNMHINAENGRTKGRDVILVDRTSGSDNIGLSQESSGTGSSERVRQITETVADEQSAFSFTKNNTTKSVTLTTERIDSILKNYGSETNPNYAQAYVTSINPKDYLKLTLSDDVLNKWQEAAQKGINSDIKPLDIDKLKNEPQTPYITIDSKTGEVIGHEGRHRMRALMNEGVENVVIVVEDMSTKYSKEITPLMRITSQDFGKGAVNGGYSVDLKNLIPTNGVFKDKITSTYGQDADIRYSRSSDEWRAHPDAWQSHLDKYYEPEGTGKSIGEIRKFYSYEAQKIRRRMDSTTLSAYFDELQQKKPAITLEGILDDKKAVETARKLGEEMLKSEDGTVGILADKYSKKINRAKEEILTSKAQRLKQYQKGLDILYVKMVNELYAKVKAIQPVNKYAYKKDGIDREMFNPSTERKEINSLINDKHIKMLNEGKYVELNKEDFDRFGLDLFDVKGMKRKEYLQYKNTLMANLRDMFREYLKQYMGKGYRLHIQDSSIEVYLYKNGVVKMTQKIDKKQGGALGRFADIVKSLDYAYSSEVVDK